jgi:hypothetical protein
VPVKPTAPPAQAASSTPSSAGAAAATTIKEPASGRTSASGSKDSTPRAPVQASVQVPKVGSTEDLARASSAVSAALGGVLSNGGSSSAGTAAVQGSAGRSAAQLQRPASSAGPAPRPQSTSGVADQSSGTGPGQQRGSKGGATVPPQATPVVPAASNGGCCVCPLAVSGEDCPFPTMQVINGNWMVFIQSFGL